MSSPSYEVVTLLAHQRGYKVLNVNGYQIIFTRNKQTRAQMTRAADHWVVAAYDQFGEPTDWDNGWLSKKRAANWCLSQLQA